MFFKDNISNAFLGGFILNYNTFITLSDHTDDNKLLHVHKTSPL